MRRGGPFITRRTSLSTDITLEYGCLEHGALKRCAQRRAWLTADMIAAGELTLAQEPTFDAMTEAQITTSLEVQGYTNISAVEIQGRIMGGRCAQRRRQLRRPACGRHKRQGVSRNPSRKPGRGGLAGQNRKIRQFRHQRCQISQRRVESGSGRLRRHGFRNADQCRIRRGDQQAQRLIVPSNTDRAR